MRFVALFAMLIFCKSVWAQDEQMTFVAYPPDALETQLMGVTAWTIYASGPVDLEADKRLEKLLAERSIPLGSSLYLHSTGGHLQTR